MDLFAVLASAQLRIILPNMVLIIAEEKKEADNRGFFRAEVHTYVRFAIIVVFFAGEETFHQTNVIAAP